MRFSVVLATDLDLPRFAAVTEHFAAEVTQRLRRDSQSVQESLAVYERFFARQDREFPLTKQIATVTKRGLPPAPPPVLALLALEAATGVLMGVQNLDAIDRSLTLDALRGAETFVGMRGNTITCRPGEIVVRDAAGIVASLLQGPDKRTSVTPRSRNLAFCVFDTDPSLGGKHDEATSLVARLVPESVGTTTVLLTA